MTLNQTPWHRLEAELDKWAQAGRRATLWWRDDDAVKPGPILDRLASAADGAPLTLAVIPALAETALSDWLADHPNISVMQHGYRHENRAPAGEKKCEFPAALDDAGLLVDLAAGRERMESLFGARFNPALAPPWNRISDSLPSKLAQSGLQGLSVYRRENRPVGPRLWIDTHCDILAWRTTRGYVGDDTALGLIVDHLRARRTGNALDEPTGVMSHHIVHDEGCWTFLRSLAQHIDRHPAAAWCNPFEVLNFSQEGTS